MKQWPTMESLVRYHQAEGFIVGDMECLECGHKTGGIHPPGTNESTLECSECGARKSKFTREPIW